MPIIIIPVPLMALVFGFVGGYAAEKFIQHAEPVIEREIKRMRSKKDQIV